MKKTIKKLITRLISVLLVMTLVVSFQSIIAYAKTDNTNPIIVVSLGDSYSSGEGIEPFYGQEKALNEKVKNEDWLAHRSQKSWPSLLKVPGLEGQMSDYNVKYKNSTKCKWYFSAVSGAETKHFNKETQKKNYNKKLDFMSFLTGDLELPKQLDIFNNISSDIDYVTLTVGGNDVGFVDIITTCVTGSTYLGSKSLKKKISKLWEDFETTKANIKQVYVDISNKAGSHANIIVAGYPKLLDKNGKGFFISKEEATIVNNNVSKFNDEIEALVKECQNSGINIFFVDVESEFDKDGGHQAYSNNAWINKIMLGTNSEDLKDKDIASAYSVHPNEEGAKAYARCVNAKIQEIENSKCIGMLSGKICKASNRSVAIPGASIKVYKDNTLYTTQTADSTGNYSISLPIGQYYIEITNKGYINFHSYATVTEGTNNYMETFLMVEDSEDKTGVASGRVVNSLTGVGVDGVTFTIRQDWNNMNESAETVTTVTTSYNGSYSVELPHGNYTVIVSKDGYLTSSFNIIVQSGITDNQNGTIVPEVSGDEYLITLTWGKEPHDLDSHIEGTLSNGKNFHVYYNHKSQYDGDIEVCNLDYDDTNSYGPEHITLKTTTNEPYYYYIYKYAGSGTVTTSGAKITIHQGNRLIAEYNVPIDLGSENYWNVFAIKDGQLITKNTITSSADTGYVN